ncbi:plasma membrane calcium-transporting ATPase 4-like [Octopus sinensis]|uniref:P-type Ca(2+) transporter n=1 Tax=Octopus sinensis TaxID=2607531 RepID=A0A6P7TU31_9MOLL|nr:plasma membrane calcium-transporting ATPase 4-like [Octopus sinensis]
MADRRNGNKPVCVGRGVVLRLDPNLIELRRQQFGSNTIPPKPPKTFLKLVLEAANDKILIILIIAAVLSFALSFVPSKGAVLALLADPHSEYQWIETVGIMFAVVVVVLVTALNDYQKEKQFIGLYGQITKDKHFSITRGGRLINVNVSDIVVGDICHLKYGDLIPTDGLILHSNDLRVDESSLTGESDIVKKNKTDNPLVYSGRGNT